MTTLEIPQRKLIVPVDQVPDKINNAALDDFQKEKFAYGELVFLENMEVSGGRIVDGKVKLVRHGDELRVELFEKKPVLEIPDSILDYKLSEKQKEDLKAERVIAIKPLKGGTLFLQVDKDLNRVMVRTERDLSLISEIGGYKLSEADKLKWANGEQLPVRVLYDEKSKTYFAASIKRTADGKGIEYRDYKSLKGVSADKIQQLIQSHNNGDRAAAIAGTERNTGKQIKFPAVNRKETTKGIQL